MKRRALLTTAGVTSIAALAGCIEIGGAVFDDPDEGDGSEGDAEPDNGEDGSTGVESIIDSGIDTVDATCAGDDEDEFSWAIEGDTVDIDGKATAPNPCHEAVFESITLDGDTLLVEIGLESTSDQACVQCVGGIEFEAWVEVDDGDGLSDVTVTIVE